MDTVSIIVLVLSILLGIWEILLTVCNLTTFFYLMKHPTIYTILLVLYFVIDFMLKIFAVVAGILAIINPPCAFSQVGIWGACGGSAVGLTVFMLWSWSNLSMGTNIALILDFVLQLGVSITVLMVPTPPNPFYRYMMVPRQLTNFYP